MAAILPNAKTQFLDSSGVPLAGGSVTTYIPSTSTPKTTWQDAAQTTANSTTITLDAAGECQIWGSGQYRQVVKDSLGNTIWDKVTSDGNSTNLLSTHTLWGNPTGSSAYASEITLGTGLSFSGTTLVNSAALITGQCQLQYATTTTLKLMPYNGNNIVINSTQYQVPDSGVTFTLSTETPVSSGTPIYYVYAYIVSGTTIGLSSSTTGYTTQAGTGVLVKSDDATKSLVGCFVCFTGPVFTYNGSSRTVRSWFNEPNMTSEYALQSDTNITGDGTNFAEVDSTWRLPILLWDNEHTWVTAQIEADGAANSFVASCVSINNTTADDVDGRLNATMSIGPAANYYTSRTLSFHVAKASGERYIYFAYLSLSTNAVLITYKAQHYQCKMNLITRRN